MFKTYSNCIKVKLNTELKFTKQQMLKEILINIKSISFKSKVYKYKIHSSIAFGADCTCNFKIHLDNQ